MSADILTQEARSVKEDSLFPPVEIAAGGLGVYFTAPVFLTIS